MSITAAEVRARRPASLPTYRTAADVLEGRTGSGLKLAGWTVLRTVMIAPPMMLVGVDAKRAWGGAALASLMITGFTLIRIANGAKSIEMRGTRQRLRPVSRRCLAR